MGNQKTAEEALADARAAEEAVKARARDLHRVQGGDLMTSHYDAVQERRRQRGRHD